VAVQIGTAEENEVATGLFGELLAGRGELGCGQEIDAVAVRTAIGFLERLASLGHADTSLRLEATDKDTLAASGAPGQQRQP
jgi:hypothetical protein